MTSARHRVRANTHDSRIPAPTVRRLPVYLRVIELLGEAEAHSVSSEVLASLSGVSDAVVRRDMMHIHAGGIRGRGYPLGVLQLEISKVLGLHRDWALGVIGVGSLGSALVRYPGFRARGFNVAAGFDVDPQKIGSIVDHVRIHSMVDLSAVVQRLGISMVVIATPADAAVEAAEAAAEAGVGAILNFAPAVLPEVEGVTVRHVDLAVELEVLAYHARRTQRLYSSSTRIPAAIVQPDA